MTPTLDPFQHDTLDFLDHARGRACIADPMGSRKTGTVLSWLARQPEGMRTLVVAPSAVHGHWVREASKFYPGACTWLGNGPKQRRIDRLRVLAVDSTEKVSGLYITTYESMKQDQHEIIKANFHTVVFDEGHALKGRRTQVALAANAVCKDRLYILIATGTPVLNHAAELWQYLHLLAPKVYTAFWKWAETHYRVEVRTFRGNRFPTRIIHGFREGHEEIVRNQIAPFFIQRDITDLYPGQAWVQEPEHTEIEVELSASERKAYTSLVKHKWASIDGVEVTTRNALDLGTRLEQLTSEWSSLNADAEAGTKVKAAVARILDLLERDEQVVVFAKYRQTVRRIVEMLQAKGVSAFAYHGDVPADERDQAVQLFADGAIKVIVGTLRSLSEGVDGLQHSCNHVVMVDRHWVPARNDQAIGRVRRSGQTRRVNVEHIFAKDTIDATVTAACLRKVNVVETLRGKPLTDAIYGRID